MPARWTFDEEKQKRLELERFYVKEQKTITEIGRILGISEQTVFQRLKRFKISSNPKFRKRQDIITPSCYSADLAEFFGIMLGDGKLSHFQVVVTLGDKEMSYANWVINLFEKIFHARPKIAIRKTGYKDVYIGSVDVTSWLRNEGLVYNKVKSQVGVPKWISRKKEFVERFIRGFFDTDGSVYRLRWGAQISFANKSLPLLKSVQSMLEYLRYSPSRVSSDKVYITKQKQVRRFFEEIQPQNRKHLERFKILCRQ